MRDLFSSDFFARNRARLLQLFTGTAPIVLTASGQIEKASGEAYAFYQDRDFWYLTGIDEPDVVFVSDKGREYLIVPTRVTMRDMFDGALDYGELARRSGITDIVDEKDGWRQLNARIKKVKHVATLAAPPKYSDRWGIYSNPARTELIRKLKDANGAAELLDLSQHLTRMRMIKQEPELHALQRAIDITTATLGEITRPSRLAKYAYEYEIEADLTRGFRRRGASGHAFTPVVASGEHTCTIHYTANNAELASDELLLLDVGAEYEHYMADIARALPLSGQPSRRQQAVFDAVCGVQDYAHSLLKPGVIPNEYEQQVRAFMGEKLRELGLIKSIDDEAVRKFFPHRTSHHLGLDVHDAGDYNRPLESGAVMAVEPGIYISNESIGVRVEDDVLITADGIKVLTHNLPRTLGWHTIGAK